MDDDAGDHAAPLHDVVVDGQVEMNQEEDDESPRKGVMDQAHGVVVEPGAVGVSRNRCVFLSDSCPLIRGVLEFRVADGSVLLPAA